MGGLKEVHILLVEDNPGDARLTAEALKESGPACRLSVARDGEEALEMLRAAARAGEALPDLMLLDLNLPRKHGREVLAEVKADPALRQVPVVVLSTSAADQDIRRAYELGANCYVVKPLDLDEFLSLIQALTGFWLGVARPPRPLDA